MSCSSTHSSMRRRSLACFRSALATRIPSPPEQRGGRAPDRHQAPHELDAETLQGGEVDLPPVIAPDDLHRCVTTGTLEVLDLVPPLVELADPVEPPVDVAAPVRTWQPDVFADRDRDIVTRSSQLIRDLHS